MFFRWISNRLLLLFILTPGWALGQFTFSGSIVNKQKKEKIAYASVGLIGENIGVNADENGDFVLVSNNLKSQDSLVFSCVGYQTLKIPVVNNRREGLLIELEEKIKGLEEVVVTNKHNWQFSVLNDFSKCGNEYVSSIGFQTQLAQHFQAPEKKAFLNHIKICRMSMPIFDPEKVVFRIRVYGMDSITNAPLDDLCDQVIEVKTQQKIISIDLSSYNIFIPERDFFVAVEWVKIPYNAVKQKIKKPDGSYVEKISYKPSIGWTNNISPKMEAWMLDYKGNWRPMVKMGDKTNVAISATVKY